MVITVVAVAAATFALVAFAIASAVMQLSCCRSFRCNVLLFLS